jgi:hypothetical protein
MSKIEPLDDSIINSAEQYFNNKDIRPLPQNVIKDVDQNIAPSLQSIENNDIIKAATSKVEPSKEKTFLDSAGETTADAGMGFIDNTTLGFADDIAGGGEALLDLLRGKGSLKDNYRKHQQEYEKLFKDSEKRSPKAYMSGGLASMLVPGKLALSGAKAAKGIKEAMVLGALGSGAIGSANVIGHSDNSIADEGGAGKIGKEVMDALPLNLGLGAVLGPIAEKLNFKNSEKAFAQTLNRAKELGNDGINIGTNAGRNAINTKFKDSVSKVTDTLLDPIKEGQQKWKDAINNFQGPIQARAGHNASLTNAFNELASSTGLSNKSDWLKDIHKVVTNPNATLSEYSNLASQLKNAAMDVASKDKLQNASGPLENISKLLRQNVVEYNLTPSVVKDLNKTVANDKSLVGRILNDKWKLTNDTQGFHKDLRVLNADRMKQLDTSVDDEVGDIISKMSLGSSQGESGRLRLEEIKNYINNFQDPNKLTRKIDTNKLESITKDASLDQSVLADYLGTMRTNKEAAKKAGDAISDVASLGNPLLLAGKIAKGPFNAGVQNKYGLAQNTLFNNSIMDYTKPGLTLAKVNPVNFTPQVINYVADYLSKRPEKALQSAGKKLIDGIDRNSGNVAATLFSVAQGTPVLRSIMKHGSDTSNKTVQDIIDENEEKANDYKNKANK